MGTERENVFTQDWDDFQQDIHKKRLKHMKPEVRKFMQSPKQGLSVETRDAKRKALKRARYLDIELENRVLLNKLSHLMRHPAEIFQAMEGERVGPRSLNKLTRRKNINVSTGRITNWYRELSAERASTVVINGQKSARKLKNI